jgi:hypothetical protein
MSNEQNNKLSISTESWFCQPCTLPNFSDSYFIEKSDADPDPQIDGTTASDVHSIDCLLFWSFDTKCEVVFHLEKVC